MLRHLPNFLTCCNLFCGCLGIAGIMNGWPIETAYFLWVAAVFDFLDGFAARVLKVSSPIGKELDSLADMVTFGVLPSVLMYSLLSKYTDNEVIRSTAFLLAIFSALRLAKFNIDTRQSDGFIGVPTPATALFITGLVFIPSATGVDLSLPVLLSITILFSLLMVAPFPLIALKFKSFGWKGNELRFTFLALAVLLIAAFWKAAVVPIILLYILMSLLGRWLAVGTSSK